MTEQYDGQNAEQDDGQNAGRYDGQDDGQNAGRYDGQDDGQNAGRYDGQDAGENGGRYVLDLREIDESQAGRTGGKAAHLGALSRIEGVRVPAGFVVTTDAFRRVMAETPSVDGLLGRLAEADPRDREAIAALSARIRRAVEEAPVPAEIETAITRALTASGERAAYAVRSSATAEDLPTASFAGQQDTYLNVVGARSVVEHVRRCWASLFTERAVTYRRRNGIDDRAVRMAVVVQRMVVPWSAGVLFTADPVTGNRRVATVDAGFGLGRPWSPVW